MSKNWKVFTPETLELYLAQNGKCFYCGKPMPFSIKKSELEISRDHFIPRSKGGKSKRNIVLCHAFCNSVKGDSNPTKAQVRKFQKIQATLRILRASIHKMYIHYNRHGKNSLSKG